MLLLCQEFDMEDAVRLWDTLLVDPSRFNYTTFVCVAMVSTIRDQIVDGDFACCMENLQKAASFVKNVQELLNKAGDLCASYYRHEVSYLLLSDKQSFSAVYIPLLNKHT